MTHRAGCWINYWRRCGTGCVPNVRLPDSTGAHRQAVVLPCRGHRASRPTRERGARGGRAVCRGRAGSGLPPIRLEVRLTPR